MVSIGFYVVWGFPKIGDPNIRSLRSPEDKI